MRDDELDLRNPLSVLGPKRLAWETLLTERGSGDLGPDGSPAWQYLLASPARGAHGRRWELAGPPTFFELPHNATLEHVVDALADFGWRLLGTTGANYVFRRPTPSATPRPDDQPELITGEP